MHSRIFSGSPQYVSHSSLLVQPPGSCAPCRKASASLRASSNSLSSINPFCSANARHSSMLLISSQYVRHSTSLVHPPGPIPPTFWNFLALSISVEESKLYCSAKARHWSMLAESSQYSLHCCSLAHSSNSATGKTMSSLLNAETPHASISPRPTESTKENFECVISFIPQRDSYILLRKDWSLQEDLFVHFQM